jgi:large repetitive protein
MTTGVAAQFGYIYALNNELSPFVEAVPASGKKASNASLLGSGFKGTTSVTFNGVAATFTVVSDTQITTAVPAGATIGTIEVTTPEGVLSSNVPFMIP